MAHYYGDIEVVVRMRWRISAEMELKPGQKPTLPEIQDLLTSEDREYSVHDEEYMETLSIEAVSENYDDKSEDTETETDGDTEENDG